MKNPRRVYLTLIYALIVWGCSIEITATAEHPQLENTPVLSSTPALPATRVPVTWSHLKLIGKLLYLNSSTEENTVTSHIRMLDLESGEVVTLFSAPGAWVHYATISPDASRIVFSYTPPRQSNTPSPRSLYVLALDGSTEPEPLFTSPLPTDRYTQAEWSPDGQYIYYVHYSQDNVQIYEDYDISRMAYPQGNHEKLVEHAFWPRLSADGTRMAYVSLDPDSGRNELFVANADGSESRRVALSGPRPPEIIDAPIFSPDGQSILFSAPEPAQSTQPNLLEKLMGIQVAKAHSVPSDWWSVPVEGGVPEQLTRIQTINLFASISPDRQQVASLSGEGLFVMDIDGSNLTRLVLDPSMHGTIAWIP
jgi:Tol biopolymer transport system component